MAKRKAVTSSDSGKRRRFLDVRNHGFLRTAVCVPRVSVGDPLKNAQYHLESLESAWRQGAAYALAPELGLSSYSLSDLFQNRVTLAASLEALRMVLEKSRGWQGMVFSVGLPLMVGSGLYNCAVTAIEGRILAVVPKAYPPNYREFYEARWFAAAREALQTEITLLGQIVPFGTDILVRSSSQPLFVLHNEVCEDIWVPIPPSARAALMGATVLANLSASDITIGKSGYRQTLVESSSGKNVAVQLYGAAGYGESSTGLSWDGDGFIAENGALLARTERFNGMAFGVKAARHEGQVIVADADLLLLAQERLMWRSFSQNAADNARPFRTVVFDEPLGGAPTYVYETLQRFVEPHPFVPSDPKELDARCYETFMIQATALMRRLETLPPERRKIVLGVSGGRDSTHALLVACYALDMLGLPRENIIGITMPGFGTTKDSYRAACDLIRAVGATFLEIPIAKIADETFRVFGYKRGCDAEDLFFENVQAWTRKHILFAASARHGGIVLGTGDLSELMLGWCTYGADHFSHYGINAGVAKTLISFLIGWAKDKVFANELSTRKALELVLSLEISPELTSADAKGGIAQKTESLVGPYELHDFFGRNFLRYGFEPSRIVRLAWHAFSGRTNQLTGKPYAIGDLKRWAGVFLRRFFANQFKRSVAADGPKVGLTSVDPRGDWRMPSDADAAAWLRELEENVPDTLPLRA